jgi:uncharacterized protein (DUF2126 family)/transglutaminase-like putative cysteine protease
MGRVRARQTHRWQLTQMSPLRNRAQLSLHKETDSMSIHVALFHRTRYSYDRAVSHAPHVVRLRPAPHCRTQVLSYSLKIGGGPCFLNWQQDPFSNWNGRLVLPEPMREFVVDVELVVEMAVHNPFDFFLDEGASTVPFRYEAALRKELAPFLESSETGPLFGAYVAEVRRELDGPRASGNTLRTIDFMVALNQRIQKDVKYVIRLEPGVQSPEVTLGKGSGSCRDSAWLMCQTLRHLGFAARFASGYLIQLAPDVKALDGPSGTEVDFTDLHAWCEVYLPGAGWIGFDPTSGLLAGEGHIPLSCTPEPASAAPVTGAVDPCESQLEHEMRITRIYESPRVTKPYTEEQWGSVLALGEQIDRELKEADVRLTMGGEPTFVSIDHPDAPEWNFDAVSPTKRVLSGELLRRLRERFAPGAVLHYGQGKWYPGEPLPRYALTALWRRDGVPVWNDPALLADEATDYEHGLREARLLSERLAHLLGVSSSCILPGYEDALYYVWRERCLPADVTVADAKLGTAQERERFRRIFAQGLHSEVGYVLPLRRSDGGGWESSPWRLRDDKQLWLVPGDSPMGLRLPLDSLLWETASRRPQFYPLDPSQALPPLPPEFRFIAHPKNAKPEKEKPAPKGKGVAAAESSEAGSAGIVRTALCVEPRNGRVHVFLPPLASGADFVELIAVLERAAAELSLPVIIEGEPPPPDPRLNRFGVTPDPGVIEVNLHPSATWAELVERTETLYEEARQTRLGTEKFMLDGRHTGTGGGNHVILGGATPADSPVLRRPDVLRSLLTYWQNHPSLSWVFGGMFIGPTSQAPRIDEARHDSLAELELAFEQVPSSGTPVPPWLVDRLFRNLLLDAAGNTHRAEFSIDKLYAPESATGRLGLLELRAFEMPPHARMSLVQQLLLRGLVSKFWEEPFQNGLVRWGTDLHDRWLLPHFCESDFRDVLDDLRRGGRGFLWEWFAPHFEFRFPKIGHFEQREVFVELRSALEPWHVLGEQPGAGGVVRYVDSSLERLQVKVRGMSGDRYALLCNGRRVPLHPDGHQR